MKKICLIALLIVLTTLISAGRYGGDFMEIGSGVRALGLGGSFTAIADDGSAIYWNAAGISQLKKIEIGVMRSYLYTGLAHYDHITYCQPLPNDVTIGVNWTRLSIPDIPIFNEQYLIGTTIDQRVTFPNLHLPGIPDGKFTSTDDLIQFAFSKHLHYNFNMGWVFFEMPIDFHFGGNIKYIKRSILDYTGTGTGFDISFLTRNDLSKWFDVTWLGDFSMGLNIQDIGGTSITWDTVSRNSDEVVMNSKLGFAYKQPIESLNSTILLATDTDYHVYGQRQRYGMEYQYDDLIAGRLGYHDENFSTGLSLKLYDINIDYALITNTLGNSHRVGLRVYF